MSPLRGWLLAASGAALLFSIPPALAADCGNAGLFPRRTAIPVFYATDRNDNGRPQPLHWGRETGEVEHFGRVDTSILRSCATLPRDYPAWWPQHEGESDKPRNYFLVHKDHPFTTEGMFIDAIRAELDRLQAQDPARPREVILYIHGFNNSFEEAAGRGARFVFDLGEPALPVIYSWPSQESPTPGSYVWDATRVQRSQPYIRALIRDIVEQVAPDRFHIIAHSMGNRATLASLLELARERPDLAQKITSLTLLAPDVDQWVFRRADLADLARFAGRVTLVTNGKDKALGASESINGSVNLGTWARGTRPFAAPGLLTIDTSNIGSSVFHHADFETEAAIMREIQAGMAGIPIEDRPCLNRMSGPEAGAYYEIDPRRPGCPAAGPYKAASPAVGAPQAPAEGSDPQSPNG